MSNLLGKAKKVINKKTGNEGVENASVIITPSRDTIIDMLIKERSDLLHKVHEIDVHLDKLYGEKKKKKEDD